MPTASTSILDHLDSLAVLAAGIFAGGTFYISVGEIPAIRAVGLDEHWRFFPHMYERGLTANGGASVVAGVAGIAHGIRIAGAPFDRNLWIIAGSVLLGLTPYTVIFLFPTNHRIIDDNKQVKLGKESQISLTTKKELLDKWAALHFVRTVGGFACFGAMIYGLSRHSSMLFKW